MKQLGPNFKVFHVTFKGNPSFGPWVCSLPVEVEERTQEYELYLFSPVETPLRDSTVHFVCGEEEKRGKPGDATPLPKNSQQGHHSQLV